MLCRVPTWAGKRAPQKCIRPPPRADRKVYLGPAQSQEAGGVWVELGWVPVLGPFREGGVSERFLGSQEVGIHPSLTPPWATRL